MKLLVVLVSVLSTEIGHSLISLTRSCCFRDSGRCHDPSTKLFSQSEGNDVSEKKLFTSLPRLYIGPKPMSSKNGLSMLTKGSCLTLDSDQAHYVTKVMRIDGKKKCFLRLFDGHSGEWLCQIHTSRNKNRLDVHATCLELLKEQNLVRGKQLDGPWIFFAPIKKNRIKLLLEKCTELGAGGFVAVRTERTDSSSLKDLFESMEKLSIQIVEASEQCERLTLPHFSGQIDPKRCNDDALVSVPELLASWDFLMADRYLLICRERCSSAIPILEKLNDLKDDKVAFLIGPEGGWSADEELLFSRQSLSPLIHCVSLGSNVLRAETAAITAVTANMLLTH